MSERVIVRQNSRMEVEILAAESDGEENQALHPGIDQGPGAHQARFNSNIEGGAGQPVIPQDFSSLAQDQNLGVGRGIVQRDGKIVGMGHHFPPVHDQHRAHRHLTRAQG